MCSVSYPPCPATAPHESEFAGQQELEEIASPKTTRNGEGRRQLLREMRCLMAKAERSF
jgi:hypothetical protein